MLSLYIVVGQNPAIFQLFPGKDEALLGSRNPFFFINLIPLLFQNLLSRTGVIETLNIKTLTKDNVFRFCDISGFI